VKPLPEINLEISKKIFNLAFYDDLFDYDNRYQVFYGGAGSGKSHFVFQKIVIKALNRKRKVLVIRKVARTLKDSCFQMALDTLSKFQLLSMCRINNTTMTIDLPNGSSFLFKGLDDSEKIKSITGITDIVIEEATEITQDEFIQLDLRLRARVKHLQIYLMFNPVSKVNWCYKYWFLNGTPPNTKIMKTTYLDNRFLPKEYVDSLERMKQTNYTYWKIYANGEFASLDKLVFTNWEVGDYAAEPKDVLVIGLDFGYVNDPSAMVAAWLREDKKEIYVVDEFYQKAKLNNEIAEMIKYKGFTKEVIIADSAEAKSIEEIRREGIPRIKAAAKGQGSVLQGIQKLQQYRIIVSPKCPNTKIELENYSWKKDKASGEYMNQPCDDYNHCIDALRYSLQCVDNKRKLETLSKAALGL
jgi:phage terminase large subunit